jgi:hypothetical protein
MMELTKDAAKICAIITGVMLTAVTFAFVIFVFRFQTDNQYVEQLVRAGAQISDDMTYIDAREQLDKSSSILMGFGVLELLLTSIFGICLRAGFVPKKETKKECER